MRIPDLVLSRRGREVRREVGESDARFRTVALPMTSITPKKTAILGGLLIMASGIVNTGLGISVGALLYEIYPGGKLGHVGMFSGLAAVVLGLLVVAVALRQYDRNLKHAIVGGILTIFFGHLGAIAGALYVGTAGVILCYGGAIWLFVSLWRRT